GRWVGGLPALPGAPRRPAAPAGPQSELARGVRQSHRAGGQHRRDRLPDTPPRPAGVAPADPDRYLVQSGGPIRTALSSAWSRTAPTSAYGNDRERRTPPVPRYAT